jgi:hypothetical protein
MIQNMTDYHPPRDFGKEDSHAIYKEEALSGIDRRRDEELGSD